ncbi:hypothetical protein LMG27174_01239 [Paraburkholderia rhynchosiae]|uniref:Uncharacterized protein n=1 Tax=Paraburkholderia rhynchosiae TaxID=487049 RepID=A0A6J5A460_9BURK|nr:hypothetical protein LMG27174_01239 [Paraburkholderia rhynchosiae]
MPGTARGDMFLLRSLEMAEFRSRRALRCAQFPLAIYDASVAGCIDKIAHAD